MNIGFHKLKLNKNRSHTRKNYESDDNLSALTRPCVHHSFTGLLASNLLLSTIIIPQFKSVTVGVNTTITSVASVRLLMPLAMLCFRSSVIVVSIMNITSKLAYPYKLTEKKRLIYMHLLLFRTSRKKKIAD